MFERFSREAREAVVGAQKVARDSGSRSVDTRHVLVALIEGSEDVPRALRAAGVDVDGLDAAGRARLRAEGLDGDALAALGIDLDVVRRRTDAIFGPGALDRAGRRPGSHIPFSADAKKALELSLREAIRLRQRSIQSGHLLLGILRADSPGRALLESDGVDADAVRQALEEEMRAA